MPKKKFSILFAAAECTPIQINAKGAPASPLLIKERSGEVK
jgi:hypothetical protein